MPEMVWINEEDQLREQFAVKDDQQAMWCIRKIQQAQKEYDQLQAHYEHELEIAKKRLDGTKERMEELLRDYLTSGIPLHETKTMWTYNLPNAKLKITKATTALAHDDDKLLPALHDAGMNEYIKIKESVNWAELKKHVLETGELLDGIWNEEKPCELKIEIKEG